MKYLGSRIEHVCWMTLLLSLSLQHLVVITQDEIMTHLRDSCIFCRICDEKEDAEVIYKDEEFVAFSDIKPAAQHHYLIIPRKHIRNARELTSEHKSLVEKLVEIGKQILEDKGGNLSDVRFGFHWPPFNSIHHLHLHVISPASSMGFKYRLMFRPDSIWFVTPDYVMSHL